MSRPGLIASSHRQASGIRRYSFFFFLVYKIRLDIFRLLTGAVRYLLVNGSQKSAVDLSPRNTTPSILLAERYLSLVLIKGWPWANRVGSSLGII